MGHNNIGTTLGIKGIIAELFLYSQNGADAFSCRLCHVPDDITLLKKGNDILVLFLLLVGRFNRTWFAPQFAPLAIYYSCMTANGRCCSHVLVAHRSRA